MQRVFDEMLKYKPSLQKMLVTDEEDEEAFDPRIQGDLIIRNFPWPIGIELRRLFSANMPLMPSREVTMKKKSLNFLIMRSNWMKD